MTTAEGPHGEVRRSIKGSVRQHRFDAHYGPEMVGDRRDAMTSLQRVADDAGRGTGSRCRYEKRQPFSLHVRRQISLGDARLEGDQPRRRIGWLDDAVHSRQVEHDATIGYRAYPVAPVAPSADRIQRHLMLVGEFHHRNDLPRIGRIDDGNH